MKKLYFKLLPTIKFYTSELKEIGLRKFIGKYKTVASVTAMSIGFIIDNFTLNRIDQVFDNLVFIFYLLIAATTLLLLNQIKLFSENKITHFHNYFLFLFQFAIGGLFSGFIVFYSRSASLQALPFVLILIAFILGNEFFNKKYQQISIRLGIFYLALILYLVFALPILVQQINSLIFLLSCLFATLLLTGFIFINNKITLNPININKATTPIASILITILVLYFLNIIPPIPLSLKSITPLYELSRTENQYIGKYSPAPWYNIFSSTSKNFHLSPDQSITVFSSIFAPTKLKTTTYHTWYYKPDNSLTWQLKDSIPVEITGGRDGGYRGFSRKHTLTEGLWRVRVETKQGQVIGQTIFRIHYDDKIPTLKTKVL